MTGHELRNKLLSKGVVLTELARALGLSQQALSNRLSVKNVKVDFVQEVEKIVGFPVLEETQQQSSSIDSLISLLQKKDEQIDRLITLLENKYGAVKNEKRNVG